MYIRHFKGVAVFSLVIFEVVSKDCMITPFHEIFQMLGRIEKSLALK